MREASTVSPLESTVFTDGLSSGEVSIGTVDGLVGFGGALGTVDGLVGFGGALGTVFPAGLPEEDDFSRLGVEGGFSSLESWGGTTGSLVPSVGVFWVIVGGRSIAGSRATGVASSDGLVVRLEGLRLEYFLAMVGLVVGEGLKAFVGW